MLSLILNILFLAMFMIYHCCVDHRCDSIMANYGSDLNESDVEFEIATSYVFECSKYVQKYYINSPRCTSILTGRSFMDEIIEGNPQVCYEMFRMDIHIFQHLCTELKMLHLLEKYTGIVLVEDTVGMLLYIVGHNANMRFAVNCF